MSDEMLENTSLPTNLWPQAIEHAVWLENRSPTKALKFEKTPWEALHGIKPDLSCEKVWGSRTYVTILLELRTPTNFTKLHTPRAELYYFLADEGESACYVWNPYKSRDDSVTMAEVDNGHGLFDEHDQPPLDKVNPRPHPPPTSESEDDESRSADSSGELEYDPTSELPESDDDEFNIRKRLIQQAQDRGGIVNSSSIFTPKVPGNGYKTKIKLSHNH